MSLVRFSGLVGSLLGLLTVAPQCAAEAAAPAVKAQPAAAITAPPVAVPPVAWRLDLSQLLQGMTRGTTVTLDPRVLSKISPFPGLSADQPVWFASSSDASSWVLAWRSSAPASLAHGPENRRLSGQGWTPLAAPCALKVDVKNGAIVACGSEDAILAFGGAAALNTANLPAGEALLGTMNARDSWQEWGIDQARSRVPNYVDPLLTPPVLAKSNALNWALADFGYALSSRLSEAAGALNHVEVSVSIDAQGMGHYRGSIQPSADSLLGSALAAARPRPAPPILTRFSDTMDSGSFADSSFILVPLFSLGKRAQALLADAHGTDAPGLTADALRLAAGACIVPNRSLMQLAGPVKGAEHSEEFSITGLEDASGACAKNLGALVKLYASFEPGSAGRGFELLKPGKDVPRAPFVARLGNGKGATYLALSTGGGFTWVSWAPSLSTLGASLKEIATGGRPHHTLADRLELAALSKTPALFAGFVRAETVSQLPLDETKAADARVPFGLTAEGARLVLAGTIEAQTLRRRAADVLVQFAPQSDWAQLSTEKRDASVSLLDATCRLGSGRACNELGVRFGDGNGVPKDVDHAQELLKIGCAGEHGMACLNSGFYGAPDTAQLTAFQKSCDLKSPLGCAYYAKRLLASSNLDDHKKALKPLEFSCANYNGFGCWELGHAYLQGVGVAKDEVKAIDYQEASCGLGFGAGCIAVGNAYADGVGRKKDAGLAMKSYEAACKVDKQGGCYTLGMAYAAGLTGAKDMTNARAQWTIACDAGHAEGCRMLAETTEAQ